MSDDVKDLLDRAAEDSLRGLHLDLPTADDVARSQLISTGSVPEAEVIPIDTPRRRARWPLGLAAAVLAILAIGAGLLAVQSADDPSPATPTTVPASDARQRLLDAIDKSVAEVFEVHYSGIADDRLQCGDPACLPKTTGMPDEPPPEFGTVWDGTMSGLYVKGFHGAPRVTKIVDGTASQAGPGIQDVTSYYQTGPDRWVSMGASEGPNPLLDFRQAAESTCVFDRDGRIVVLALGTPCGSTPGIQYEVTLDTAGRVASIGSVDRDDAMVRFEYSDVPRPRLPDPSQVSTRANVVATGVDPVTGYWTIEEIDTSGPVGPTTTVVSEVGGP